LTELVTPLKPLEAIAMGQAIIASKVGGHWELIEDGETEMLFQPGSAEVLAAAMERLVLDREFKLDLGRGLKAGFVKNAPGKKPR
jgi:glycosyltransferase involved in cell wall biosynthesis